jgi:hypothetical protein
LLLQPKIYTVVTGTDISTFLLLHAVTDTDISTSLLWKHKIYTAVTDTDIATSLFLQHKIYQQAVKVPEELRDIINEETYNKARVYGLDSSSFGILKELFNIIATIVRNYVI